MKISYQGNNGFVAVLIAALWLLGVVVLLAFTLVVLVIGLLATPFTLLLALIFWGIVELCEKADDWRRRRRARAALEARLAPPRVEPRPPWTGGYQPRPYGAPPSPPPKFTPDSDPGTPNMRSGGRKPSNR